MTHPPSEARANAWDLFVAQLKADRKRAAVLGVLCFTLVVMIGRAFMGGPKPAEADAMAIIPIQNGGAAQAPTESTGAPRPMNRPTAEAPGSSHGISALADAAIAIDRAPRGLSRDLFETDWQAFPPSAEALAARSRAAASRPAAVNVGSIWTSWLGALQKNNEQVELRRKTFDSDLQGLKLQATVLGDAPKACINGQWLHEGDIIGGFRITHISARDVTLHKSGLSARLSMR